MEIIENVFQTSTILVILTALLIKIRGEMGGVSGTEKTLTVVFLFVSEVVAIVSLLILIWA